jgi:hypothetical protein
MFYGPFGPDLIKIVKIMTTLNIRKVSTSDSVSIAELERKDCPHALTEYGEYTSTKMKIALSAIRDEIKNLIHYYALTESSVIIGVIKGKKIDKKNSELKTVSCFVITDLILEKNYCNDTVLKIIVDYVEKLAKLNKCKFIIFNKMKFNTFDFVKIGYKEYTKKIYKRVKYGE